MDLLEINAQIRFCIEKREKATTLHDMIHYDWRLKELRREKHKLQTIEEVQNVNN